MRDVRFRPTGSEDLLYWQAADRKLFRKLIRLIGEIQRDPFAGIGKPEPLKGDPSGYWSRRIDDEHRLIYRATEKDVVIIKARYHY
ncbi:Txe/YoeB family addiction module toxin [Streptomyces sp. DH20]|uniref:Txe/YoeB family addiction module toxin n=1 Tax=Streptomyces sp. DH20 TaxID=2857009 RepID=UPI001E5372B6|nr:Txe/YoeB family addiction module toxin [Streptomyces sp. DH20]MCP9991205.1 Txe/YoeB family addiction module toxin [Streptomyces albogriseolus]